MGTPTQKKIYATASARKRRKIIDNLKNDNNVLVENQQGLRELPMIILKFYSMSRKESISLSLMLSVMLSFRIRDVNLDPTHLVPAKNTMMG